MARVRPGGAGPGGRRGRAGRRAIGWSAGLAFALIVVGPPGAAARQGGAPAEAPAPLVPDFLAREGTGTSWVPDDTPMFAVMRRWRGWGVMLHGNAFLQVVAEDTARHRTGGDRRMQVSGTEWGMAVLRRPLAGGRVGVRAMLSAEPWTVGDCGYLNVLATGETCDGDTIHDRQHPHDALMELAVDYVRPLGGAWRWQVYGAASGEPALGPGGFPHRVSAMGLPTAPIAHHWLDATHVSFGVVTAGLASPRWKLDASAFNGREPDERRAGLEVAPLDSVSGRLSFAPSARVSLQASAGHLREAEAEPGSTRRFDLTRATASAAFHRTAADGTLWATLAAWGVNVGREPIDGVPVRFATHAVLVESARVGARSTWVARAEVVGKPAHDLHAHEFGAAVFTVARLAAGYTRHFPPRRHVVAGLGGVVSASVVPSGLAPRYGGRVVPGVTVFLHLRPAPHVM
ncbi:MAG: hypothetical protein R2708_12100 [Vicinamibacterales bacterium]